MTKLNTKVINKMEKSSKKIKKLKNDHAVEIKNLNNDKNSEN